MNNVLQDRIVNLTPHIVRVRKNRFNRNPEPQEDDIVLMPEETPARVDFGSKVWGSVNGIDIVKNEYGAIVGLPDPEYGTIYVTSSIVAQRAALMGRSDVVAPWTNPKQDIRYGDDHPMRGQTFAVYCFQMF